MLQQPEAEDYVIASGRARSVRELVQIAFACVGLDWEKCVTIDPALFRPAEVEHLVGDASKARAKLGWEPRVSFEEMIHRMVENDMKLLERESSG